jgi:hypothetical protein
MAAEEAHYAARRRNCVTKAWQLKKRTTQRDAGSEVMPEYRKRCMT